MKNNRKVIREREAMRELAISFWGLKANTANVLDVIGIDDMVRISGFTKGTLYVFSTRDDFPAPVARKGQKLLWRRDGFDFWLQRRDASASRRAKAR